VVRLTIRDVIVVQSINKYYTFVMADKIFKALNIPLLYIGLFHIFDIRSSNSNLVVTILAYSIT